MGSAFAYIFQLELLRSRVSRTVSVVVAVVVRGRVCASAGVEIEQAD